MLIELWWAPIVLAITACAFAIAVWRGARQQERHLHKPGAALHATLQLAVILLAGLWLGIYLVFWLVDSKADSTINATIPIRFDGESASSLSLLAHGLLSTVAVATTILGIRAPKRQRHRKQE